MKKVLALTVFALVFTVSMAHADLGTTTDSTSTLTVTVLAEGGLTVDSTAALSSSGTTFANYTNSALFNFRYYVRTGASTSSNITVQVAPFTGGGTNKPPVANLSYVTTISSGPAVKADGSAPTSATPIATFPAEAHSALAGNTGTILWTLINDPVYSVGGYSANVTFTINAL